MVASPPHTPDDQAPIAVLHDPFDDYQKSLAEALVRTAEAGSFYLAAEERECRGALAIVAFSAPVLRELDPVGAALWLILPDFAAIPTAGDVRGLQGLICPTRRQAWHASRLEASKMKVYAASLPTELDAESAGDSVALRRLVAVPDGRIPVFCREESPLLRRTASRLERDERYHILTPEDFRPHARSESEAIAMGIQASQLVLTTADPASTAAALNRRRPVLMAPVSGDPGHAGVLVAMGCGVLAATEADLTWLLEDHFPRAKTLPALTDAARAYADEMGGESAGQIVMREVLAPVMRVSRTG